MQSRINITWIQKKDPQGRASRGSNKDLSNIYLSLIRHMPYIISYKNNFRMTIQLDMK